MKITIDTDTRQVVVAEGGEDQAYSFDDPKAFSIISQPWLRCGWEAKYSYSFTWLGRPIIQLPEDVVLLQELIFTVRPDVIIETGVAHGGSVVFYASLCKAIGRGRVVGVDIEVRPHNRTAIESHFLFPYITLIEGSSVSPQVMSDVRNQIGPGETVFVILDSCHTKNHVLSELQLYAPLVSAGSYIIVMDGIMEQVAGAPRTHADWIWDNPKQAASEFVAANPEFEVVEPPFIFNEGMIKNHLSYCSGGFLRRRARD